MNRLNWKVGGLKANRLTTTTQQKNQYIIITKYKYVCLYIHLYYTSFGSFDLPLIFISSASLFNSKYGIMSAVSPKSFIIFFFCIKSLFNYFHYKANFLFCLIFLWFQMTETILCLYTPILHGKAVKLLYISHVINTKSSLMIFPIFCLFHFCASRRTVFQQYHKAIHTKNVFIGIKLSCVVCVCVFIYILLLPKKQDKFHPSTQN